LGPNNAAAKEDNTRTRRRRGTQATASSRTQSARTRPTLGSPWHMWGRCGGLVVGRTSYG
jgi:hypothetical protein